MTHLIQAKNKDCEPKDIECTFLAFGHNSSGKPLVIEVTAKWNPKELDCSWLIETGLPAATFDIIEEYGELYCRGIVIEKADIEEELSQVKQQ